MSFDEQSRLAALILGLSIVSFGCSSDDSTGGDGGSGGAGASGGSGGSSAGTGGGSGASGSGGTGLPGIDELDPGWNTLEPGGDTLCSRGTPFRYFVRPGTVNRLVVEFRGGGACWNELTCSIAGSLFEEKADPDAFILNDAAAFGIQNHNEPKNPFKDWHHVYVPYCTGDVHWGDASRSYGSGAAAFTINHKGAVNTRAVLDWIYENFATPERIFVTGCSAGAYGSIMWTPHIRNHYQSSKILQFADSGAGIITDAFFQESFPQWNAKASYPTFIPGVNPDDFTRLPQLYELIGTTFPDTFLSAYNTMFDDNQHFYYNAMGGGDANEWSQKMQASVAEIKTGTPNFRAFIAPGFQHCIIPQPNFYTIESGGTLLVDWLQKVANDEPVDSVSCEPDCGAPKP